MTVIFSEEDSEKLTLEGILNGIDCGVANYQAVGLVHVRFVFVLPLDLGHGQALKRRKRNLHPRHTNSSERFCFQDSKVVIKDSELKPSSMHSLCILKHGQKPSALWQTNTTEQRSLINNVIVAVYRKCEHKNKISVIKIRNQVQRFLISVIISPNLIELTFVVYSYLQP